MLLSSSFWLKEKFRSFKAPHPHVFRHMQDSAYSSKEVISQFPKQFSWRCARCLTFPQKSLVASASHNPKERQSLFFSAAAVIVLKHFRHHILQFWEFVEQKIMEGMTLPEGNKKCWGCTSLRSGTLIIGSFDIAVSTIAIIVSVAALVNVQVLLNSSKCETLYECLRRKSSLNLKKAQAGVMLPNVRGWVAKQCHFHWGNAPTKYSVNFWRKSINFQRKTSSLL